MSIWTSMYYRAWSPTSSPLLHTWQYLFPYYIIQLAVQYRNCWLTPIWWVAIVAIRWWQCVSNNVMLGWQGTYCHKWLPWSQAHKPHCHWLMLVTSCSCLGHTCLYLQNFIIKSHIFEKLFDILIETIETNMFSLAVHSSVVFGMYCRIVSYPFIDANRTVNHE